MKRLEITHIRKIAVIADEAIYHLGKLKDKHPDNEWLTEEGVRVIVDRVGGKLNEIREESR